MPSGVQPAGLVQHLLVPLYAAGKVAGVLEVWRDDEEPFDARLDPDAPGPRKALTAAEKTLKQLKSLVEGSRKVNGKLSATTVRKAEKMLKEAV